MTTSLRPRAQGPASSARSPAQGHAPRPVGEGLVERPVLVAKEQVAYLRYLLEAHDGLAFLHGDGSGVVHLVAPESQAPTLDLLIADLEAEGLVVHLR